MNTNFDGQLARMIYLRAMSTMKFTLEMEEQQYKEQGRNDPRYRFFKKMIMSKTYDNLRELFGELKDLGIICETQPTEDLKNGYQDTASGGSGFVNAEEYHEWLYEVIIEEEVITIEDEVEPGNT